MAGKKRNHIVGFDRAPVDQQRMKMYDFDELERAKFVRFLEREMIKFDFRIQELGARPEVDVLKKYWKNQRAYYAHARKFCKGLVYQLNRRKNFEE